MMIKPTLYKKELPSTAISKNLLSGTYGRNLTTTSKTTDKHTQQPMISSFNNPSHKREEITMKPIKKDEKESTFSKETGWINTTDIEVMIRRTIESDIEQSIERNFGTEKYCLGPQRVCAQKVLPLPQEIRPYIVPPSQRRHDQERKQCVYGYLSGLNAVYYIIGQDLFIFNVEELKQRNFQEHNVQPYRPTKLKPNCRKIHEVNFPLNQNGKSVINLPLDKILIMQYPYSLQLCSYTFENLSTNPQQNSVHKRRNFITVVDLHTRLPLETVSAQFITPTSEGSLLYLDQKGCVNCFSFKKTDDTLLKRKTHQQNVWRKKTFISRNRGFFKAAKVWVWQKLDFTHSLHLAKRKNLAMIYDKKNFRIYTLTIKGDRTTIFQSLKKQIKVYTFVPGKNVTLECLWAISEQQILVELGMPTDKPQLNIFTILKAEPDYNQQTSLIVLLSTGIKAYLDITQQNLKVRWTSCPPELQSLSKNYKFRNETLCSLSNTVRIRDSNEMARKWGQKYDIRSAKNGQMRVKGFFNDRAVSVGLMRVQRQIQLYMTLRRHTDRSDQYDVFPIEFKNVNIFRDTDNFPHQNEIYLANCPTLQTEASQRFAALEQQEVQEVHRKRDFYKPPVPLSSGSHQLLRQVHHGPRYFTYLSNKFIASFTLVRPIDMLYYIVSTREEMFCELYLSHIMGIEPFEICCMLLQIYSSANDFYYISKKYKNKVQDVIDSIKENAQRFQSAPNKSLLAISSSEWFTNKQKKIFQDREKEDDKLVRMQEKLSDQFRSKVRRLFAIFNKQQRNRNPNPFEKVGLKFKTSDSTQINETIKELSQEQKSQAKYCEIYISRVVYPFWRAQTLTRKSKQPILKVMQVKVRQLFGIVELLKMQTNPFWMHLKGFINKLLQIIQIFMVIPNLPPDLTIEQAISKDAQYFQPFIFTTLLREYDIQMIRLFEHKFPIYITGYFRVLVNILKAIKDESNVEKMKAILDRLDEYPDYFIDYLRKEKRIFDHTVLKIKDEQKFRPVTLEVPDLPFESLMPFFFSKVKSTSVKIDEKFMYLREANKKLESFQKGQQRVEEIVSPYVLQRYQRVYDQVFKCLKLQQECKMQIQQNLQEQMTKQSKSRQQSGYFKSFFSKLSESFSHPTITEDKLGKLSKESRKAVRQENEQIFSKLDYLAMQQKQLYDLINNTQNPRLAILYIIMFTEKTINQGERQNKARHQYDKYRNLVQYAQKKFNINSDREDSKGDQKFAKMITFIKCEIKEIFIFLNSIKTPLPFIPLYQGLKEQLFKHKQTYNAFITSNKQHIYSVVRQLAELGYNKQIMAEHIIHDSLPQIFISADLQRELSQQKEMKRWVYDWWMMIDMAKKYKKDELPKLHKLTEDFLIFKAEVLATQDFQSMKKLIQSEGKIIINMINQKFP